LMVILADKTDPVSFLKETQAVFQILAAELKREDIASDLVRSVIASLNEVVAQDSLEEVPPFSNYQVNLLRTIQSFSSVADGQKQAIAHLNEVSTILVSKVTIVQAEEFRQWVLALATQVAKTVKEDGIFGIGGERISRKESDALSAIEKALNFKL
jgi:hypothetical protein